MEEDIRRYKTFPLRISPSLRQQASEFATSEGISLNHLINMAVAEKVSRMETKASPNEKNSSSSNEQPSLLHPHEEP